MTTTISASRPPLSSIEQDILRDLVKKLTKSESQFCCGGTILVPEDRKINLLYKTGDRDRALSLDLPPQQAEQDVKKLLDACTPSAHGLGKETVFDESYRLARELQQDSFALTMDILNESGVLASIAALTSPRNPSDGLVAQLYKLNAYASGGFFKAHRDTPKSDRHIGTLIVALPVPFEGGALRVSHEDKHVMFDWGAKLPGTTGKQVALPWAFLFSDIEHEVLPVTSGARITLAYDIFASEEPFSIVSPAMDGTTLPFYSDFKAVLQNKDFLPQGGKVAMALSHAYAANANGISNAFAGRLKGADAALYRALSALEISMELRAVYSPYSDGAEYEIEKDQIPVDEFGPTREVKGYYGRRILYTSDNFEFYEGHDERDVYDEEIYKSDCGGRVEPELIWARKPSGDAFSNHGYYIHYGNQASLGSLYIAAALVLNIPAVGQQSRVPA
ncbi:hypothetical protein K439DRAFT_460544 [Ramaria rubella]|nr:hypothetical protein K439DRAFT_460544 [Ramaria rubella]